MTRYFITKAAVSVIVLAAAVIIAIAQSAFYTLMTYPWFQWTVLLGVVAVVAAGLYVTVRIGMAVFFGK